LLRSGPVTERSGIGPVELSVLRAVEAKAAHGPDGYMRCADVLPVIEQHTGIGPRYAFDILLDLARPWVITVPLITVQGHMGSRDHPAPGPQYAECRPSPAGQAVLDAEVASLPPVPAGLINGTAYRGGIQPPLQPARVIATLRHLLDHPSAPDSDILDLAGHPYSVTGATVTGDLDALAAGQRITLRQTGQITRTGHPVPPTTREPLRATPLPPGTGPGPPGPGPHLVSLAGPRPGWEKQILARAHLLIESLPPASSPAEVASELGEAARTRVRTGHSPRRPRLPIDDIADLSRDSRGTICFAITLLPGTDIDDAYDQLAGFDGITTEAPAGYPGPLASLLRDWTEQHRGEDVTASLSVLEHAIHNG
jgi:hypothetical protein